MCGSRILIVLTLLGTAAPSLAGSDSTRQALIAREAALLTVEAERAVAPRSEELAPETPAEMSVVSGLTLQDELAAAPATTPVPGEAPVPEAESSRFGAIPPFLAFPGGSRGAATATVLALLTLTAVVALRYAGRRRTAPVRAADLREVTWRFRSKTPLRIGADSVARVTAVLDDIEDLGHRLRSITTGPREESEGLREVAVDPRPRPAAASRPDRPGSSPGRPGSGRGTRAHRAEARGARSAPLRARCRGGLRVRTRARPKSSEVRKGPVRRLAGERKDVPETTPSPLAGPAIRSRRARLNVEWGKESLPEGERDE